MQLLPVSRLSGGGRKMTLCGGVIILLIIPAPYAFTWLEEAIFNWRMSQQSETILTQQERRKDELDLSMGKLFDELEFSCSLSDRKKLSLAAINNRYIFLTGVVTNKNMLCTSLGEGVRFTIDKVATEYTGKDRINFFKVGDSLDGSKRLAFAYSSEKGTLFSILSADSFYSLLDNACSGCFYVELFVDEQLVFNIGAESIKNEPLYRESYFFKKNSRQAMKIYAGDALRVDSKKILHNLIKISLCLILLILLVIWGITKIKNKTLLAKLKKAIKYNEFFAFYQPVFDVRRQQFVGAEVLVRWNCNNEWISPSHFIPYAEEKNLIIPVTDVVIKKAVLDMAQLPDDFWYSINISAKHFIDEQLIKSIAKLKYIDPKRVSFEITERNPIRDIESANRQIKQLSSQGYNFKLDDFGTGYGGIAYLQLLSIRSIKIDKMFIDTIGTDDFKLGVLESIIAFGIESNYQVIAEGVETKAQADFLYSKGVTLHQGYFYAKPMNIRDLLACVYQKAIL
ncbi:MAG: EAL domain-containing protein [Aeromonas veronii]